VFYNSFLPEIAEPEEMGVVSANAWAVGSFGGIICLLILLPLNLFIGGSLVVRLSFVFTALFFAVSAIPMFLWIQEKAIPKQLPQGENILSIAFKRIVETGRSLKDFKDFVRFIISFFIYNDGILMALNFAAIIGGVMFGMDDTQIIIFMIIVQVTSIPGAYYAGVIGNRIGFKKTLIYSIAMMAIVILSMNLATSTLHFFIIGALAGIALTGVQSVSRSLVGYFAPEGRSAEFYGFFAVTGRTSSFIGPFVYKLIATQVTLYYLANGFVEIVSEQMGHRYAIGSIVVFLLAGLVILLGVKDPSEKFIKT
jgi:UMF1 family MFS transporter